MMMTIRCARIVAAVTGAVSMLGCFGSPQNGRGSLDDSVTGSGGSGSTTSNTGSGGDGSNTGGASGNTTTGGSGNAASSGGSSSGGGGTMASTGGTSSAGAAGGGGGTGMPGQPSIVSVHLVPNGAAGTERVNFAVPLSPGALTNDTQVRVLSGDTELAAALRGLSRYPDGSIRSEQVQVELSVPAEMDLEVQIGESPAAGSLSLVSVDTTLVNADGSEGPRVWAVLPAEWLSASGVFGPQTPEAAVAGTSLEAWSTLCDYDTYGVDAFLGLMSDSTVWLYDRGTTLYRGYARRGDLSTLRSAYLETSIYRNGITGTGSETRIGVAGKEDDLKYHYAQNLALHYLLTGDDRFRESAEQVATRVHDLWMDPGYAGGADFWTERHAGFSLLAYVWTAIVSDDRAGEFRALADEAVDAYISVQETYPIGYTDSEARCFAHDAEAHGETYGYFGCSPWMSAIVADGLDAYASESDATRAAAATNSIVKLGRILAREGRDDTGKPYYWMGVGDDRNEIDDYDEHWGESAYVIAMAWYYGDRSDAALRTAADELITGLRQYGEAPHMRSFNWQCRSAVATPWYLQ